MSRGPTREPMYRLPAHTPRTYTTRYPMQPTPRWGNRAQEGLVSRSVPLVAAESPPAANGPRVMGIHTGGARGAEALPAQ